MNRFQQPIESKDRYSIAKCTLTHSILRTGKDCAHIFRMLFLSAVWPVQQTSNE